MPDEAPCATTWEKAKEPDLHRRGGANLQCFISLGCIGCVGVLVGAVVLGVDPELWMYVVCSCVLLVAVELGPKQL